MITAINNIYRPAFKQRKNGNNTRINTRLNTNSCDKFCKSDIKKEEKPQMSQKYEQQNPQFNKDNAISTLEKRAKKMPMKMDSIILGLVGYLKGNIDKTNYAQSHINKSVPFYTRIELGQDAEEYKENYKNEISLIKAISQICDSYTKEQTDNNSFDALIENASEQYINTEIKNQKRFII